MLSINDYLSEVGTDKWVVEPGCVECAASSTETSGLMFFAREMRYPVLRRAAWHDKTQSSRMMRFIAATVIPTWRTGRAALHNRRQASCENAQMTIAPEGTFDYVFNVDADVTGDGRLRGRVRDGITRGARYLIGQAPVLRAVEEQRTPWQLYARVTLTASERSTASVARASFSIERGLIRVLRPNDQLYLSRTHCGGIGLSIIRDVDLVAAAGVITAVPLGSDVSARIPWDLVRQAEAIFQSRDAEYCLADAPIEVAVAGHARIVHSARPQMGPYDIFVRHGFLAGIPGTDACASIERRGVCPDTAAHTSAQLLAKEGIDITQR